MKKAFALLRVSSAGQTKRAGADEGYSIEMQRETCQRKAAELGSEVAQEWVAPAESASRGFYKTLTEMIAALKVRGDIDYVIVYKLERFARDELTDFAAYAEIKKAGAELVSATESIDGTPQGMLMHGILASINAYYSRDLAQKITDGRTTKAKLGGTPGRTPLGYLNVKRWEGKNDIRTVEVDPERVPHIQWAFQAYATSEWPLKKLTKELYRRGLRSKSTPKRPPGKVGVSTVHLLLRNTYYIGKVKFRGVEYDGDHPQFIPNELFERVQQILTASNLAGDKHWKHGHYLKGTLFCGQCGRRLIYTKCRGNGGRYDYFVCSGRHEKQGCQLPYLPVHRVEHFVTRHYESAVTIDAERVAELEPRLVEQFRRLVGHRQHEIVRCQKIVDDILGQRELLVESHLANPKAVPLDLLEAKQTDLNNKLNGAEKKLTIVAGNLDHAEDGLKAAQQFLASSSDAYGRVDPQTRRRWNQVFFKKLFVRPTGISGAELTDEFGALLREDLSDRLEAMAAQPRLRFGSGSNVNDLVELAGLEPATSWVRSKGVAIAENARKHAISSRFASTAKGRSRASMRTDTNRYAGFQHFWREVAEISEPWLECALSLSERGESSCAYGDAAARSTSCCRAPSVSPARGIGGVGMSISTQSPERRRVDPGDQSDLRDPGAVRGEEQRYQAPMPARC